MIEIIPALDIIDGKCVRLEQGDFDRKTVYDADPSDAAKRFRDAGLFRLHMVDLDAARCGEPRNLKTLERVAAVSGMAIDFGGGIRTSSNVTAVLTAGAAQVSIGSLAVKDRAGFASLVEEFGPDRFLPGADVRNEMITIDGWKTDTDIGVFDLLEQFQSLKIAGAFVTDVGRDGMLQGPAVGLYRKIRKELPGLHLIASGGIGSMDDIHEMNAIGCTGVIVGKALYEGRISLQEISEYVGQTDHTVS